MIFKNKTDAYSYIKNLTKDTDLRVIDIRHKGGSWGLTVGKNENDCCDYYIRPMKYKTIVITNPNGKGINRIIAAGPLWISCNWMGIEVPNKVCRAAMETYIQKHKTHI